MCFLCFSPHFIGVNNYFELKRSFQVQTIQRTCTVQVAFPWENGLYLGVTVANTTYFLPSNLPWKRLEREAQKKQRYTDATHQEIQIWISNAFTYPFVHADNAL